MIRVTFRRAAGLAPILALLVFALPARGQGTQFGENKVQYTDFQWRILKSDHFDNYFYPAESLAVFDLARLAERCYARHSDEFRFAFSNDALIFYADQPDFQQTNVIGDQLDEGTGGVTEGERLRVIMPATGVPFDNNHVLCHELTHVFQYKLAENAGGLQHLDALPLWLIEGMAEYFSLGRNDELTAMWMRDAVLRNRFPTIRQLTVDPRFFPYRYGQALWAYVGGRWGDRAIIDVYQRALSQGWEFALRSVLGESSDSLSKDWAAASKETFLPQAVGRTNPDSVGTPIIPLKRSGDYNIGPALSPDGKYVAYYSSRGLFSIDLYLADAHTGKIIKKLAGASSDSHFDALSFVQASGDWSPDASKFAFIVYANGNNEIAILDVKSGNVERRIHLADIGGILQLAWSPDGKSMAVSGMAGGVDNLYLVDLASEHVTQLTNERFAEIEPAWSPDGKTLAFVSDRGTDFQTMAFGKLQLTTMDVATKTIRTYPVFPKGNAINPQFSPDGQNIYFISDQDGISDLYRLNLPSNQAFRITHVATGISGITSESPAISVARQTGQVLVTVFKDQGHGLFALDPSQLAGTPAQPATDSIVASALPPTETHSLVSSHLADPTTGLPTGHDFTVIPYNYSFSLAQLGQPALGVAVGGPFGTMIQGGIEALFDDQLSDRQIYTELQASGTVKDIGGEVEYINMKKRWNWAVSLAHVPYLTGGAFLADSGGAVNEYFEEETIIIDDASVSAQYPLSTTKRFELAFDATHLAYNIDILEYTTDADGDLLNSTESSAQKCTAPGEQFETVCTPPSAWFVAPRLSFVSDNSNAAWTSPVEGSRYRIDYSPTFGTFDYQTVSADWRHYAFFRPFTLAVRAYHLGRYGRDSDSPSLFPLFVGDETLIRGYGYGSFTSPECTTEVNNGTSCPVLDRMFGSRIASTSVEFRIPLLGSPVFGLLTSPLFPVEVAPFFDGGIAWTADQPPDLRWASDAGLPSKSPSSGPCSSSAVAGEGAETVEGVQIGCADRIPVFSTGVSFRVNLMGYFIFEAYYAHPFQRPLTPWVWGFQLMPGW